MRKLYLIGALVSVTAISACAPFTTHLGVPSSQEVDAKLATRQLEKLNTTPTVAIRWPVAIVGSARNAVDLNVSRYTTKHFNGVDQPAIGVAPDLVEASSTYFAMQIYYALRRLGTPINVLLDPQLVSDDGRGGVKLTALFGPTPPVDVVANLWGAHPIKYGYRYSMLSLTIQAQVARRPATCGFLYSSMVSEPTNLLECESDSAGFAAASSYAFDGIIDSARRRARSPRAFADAIVPSPATISVGPANTTKEDLLSEPLLTPAPWFGPRASNSRVTTKRIAEVAQHFANLIALKAGEIGERPNEAWLPYLRDFDPSAAVQAQGNSGQGSTSVAASKMNLIKKMEAAELNLLAQRHERVASAILLGELGQKFEIEQAKTTGSTTFLGFLADVATVMLTSTTAASRAQASGSLTPILSTARDWSIAAEQVQSENFKRFAPAMQRVGELSVKALDQDIAVVADDQEAIRKALKIVYGRYAP